jgi:PAS domain S-box-containing protein
MAKADILIVEDESATALDLEHGLRQLGYSVVGVAASEEEAIQRALEVRPDLVLMGMGCRADGRNAGLGALGGAEERRTHLRVPVVYLIDGADREMLRQARETVPFGYLVKPLDEEKLSTTIQMALHTHEMENALRESERRYRLLSESVSDVIWTTELDMRPTDVSPSVSRLLGYSVEETMSGGMAERLTAASLEECYRAIADLQGAAEGEFSDSDGTKKLELEFICEDGTTVWTDVQASLLRDSADRPSGLLWVIHNATQLGGAGRGSGERHRDLGGVYGDVGERQRAEAALRETNQELERCLQERITQLERTNAGLVRALDQHKGAEAKLGELNREWLSLQSAAAATASSLDLQFVLETVTWEMGELLKVEGCAIFQWDREADTISVIADHASARGQGRKVVGEAYSLADYPLRKRMLAERYAQQVTIDELDVDSAERAYMQKRNIKSLLTLPMSYQDRVIGLVEMRGCQENRVFSDREISLAQMLSTQAASAIENARLYKRAQREIAHRLRAEEELKASLGEKEALLQEIHHRVKNNLQVICSLLNLQSRSIQDQDTLQMFRESQDRVRSMALIHEKLYRSQDMARVDFADYLRNLAHHLVRSYGADSNRVKLRMTLDDVPLTIEKAVPCGLITNELISNALKHAFPDGRDGEIQVALRSEGDQRLTLSVADSGVGLPAGTGFDATETLGLQLIKVLNTQLGGTAEVQSGRGTGTEVSITFAAS